jgi:hypothetical protein
MWQLKLGFKLMLKTSKTKKLGLAVEMDLVGGWK